MTLKKQKGTFGANRASINGRVQGKRLKLESLRFVPLPQLLSYSQLTYLQLPGLKIMKFNWLPSFLLPTIPPWFLSPNCQLLCTMRTR
jgi:hypothetical protein